MHYFFLDENNERKGPYTKKELLDSGLLNSDTLVWHAGCEDWKQFKDVFPDESSSVPPSPNTKLKTAENKISTPKRRWVIVAIIASFLLTLVVSGLFSYRHFLVTSAMDNFKLTGFFDESKLKTAEFLGSDFAVALLGLAYVYDGDSLQASIKFDKLKKSKDWRAIALRNDFLNENHSDAVSEGINEKVDNGDWFWLLFKGLFNASHSLTKSSADMGCVAAMIAFADLSDNISDKCVYWAKVIKSDWQRKESLGKIFFASAYYSLRDDGCKLDDSDFLNYANKAIQLGSTEGHYLLGIAYQNGKGVQVDNEKAFINYKKAADYGMPDAVYQLSQCYKHGIGIPQNSNEYNVNLKKASDLGLSLATNELEENRKREEENRKRSGSKFKRCKCCGSTFDVSYGWGYSSDGPYRNGSGSNLLSNWLTAAFGGKSDNSDLKYCTNRCAWTCR
jgi:hypothetical protein